VSIEDTSLRACVASRIYEVRLARNMPQEELARRCGWRGRQAISNIELGRSGLSIEKLYRIAAALNVHPFDLLPQSSRKTQH
jgi:transcriptional regulator with XRE-family HTH domain